MKKLFLLLSFIFVSFISSNAQELPCLTKVHPDTSSIPKYLRPGWGQVDSAKVIIVFVDFPDGRYINGNDTLQPLDTAQLKLVLHKDAAGEVGLSTEFNNFYVGENPITHLDLYMKPAKYSWHDRWQMYFSKDGSYNGMVHPDNISNGEYAYGSFAEYWQEVSGGKFNIQPAVTHPLEQDYERRTGILNNYIDMGNGRYVVDYLTLPWNKYGNDSNSCYFPNGSVYSFWPNEYWNRDVSRIEKIQDDCISAARTKFPDFGIDNFMSNGGTVIFVIAGGHYRFKGMGDHNGSNFTLIRSRIDTLEGANSCLGGIGVMAHEFAHVTPNLKWGHTNSGRYCIMDFIDVHDRNCPQHPSPFLKIQEGWLTPIALEHTQSGAVIPPVETSHQVGIVTVYGKPTAYPDIQTGEYYILENRRLLGFDRKVVESHSLNFKGGLLLWHYSPYNRVVPYSDKSGAEQRVQLRAPYYKEIVDTNIFYGDSVYLAGSHGEEKHFFAWKLDIDSANYYYYDSSRTYSTFNLKTGLALNNITNDYTNILGNITLDINYKICDPPNYSYVMRSDGTSNQTYDFSGNIFIHNSNMENKYIFREGSAIDVINGFSLKAVKCNGTENNHIIINGAGYSNYRTKSGFSVQNLSNPLLSDSIIIKYCDLYRSNPSNTIMLGEYNKNISIENFNVYDTSVLFQFIGDQTITPHLSKYEYNNIPKILISSKWYFDMDNDFSIPENSFFENNNICQNDTNPTNIVFSSSTQSKILCNGKMKIFSDFICNRDIVIGNSGEIGFYSCSIRPYGPTTKFSENTGITCYGNFIAQSSFPNELNKLITFDREGESGFWNGIYCYNSSSFYMNGAEIKNANNGIYISHGTPDIDIINSNFDSNYYSDIYLEQMTFGEGSPAVISYNKFNDLLTHLYGIGCNEINNVDINNNQFDDVFNIGIFLEHSSNFKVLSNRIYAPLINGPSAMTGIYCYQSDGFLSCNEITNFLDGILFDNSSPYLLNNEIYNNGYGLYLTNSSNPILSPSYSQSQSLYNAGYNKIYNCEGPEIFCDNNFGFPISLPYLYNGQNSIYDSSNQVLISTNLSYYDDPLQAQQNFWGQVPTSQMFYPDYSVVYSDYLSREPTYTNCSPELISENNDSLNQNILLLGSSNINYYTKNYSSAISGYKQIINSYSSNLLNSLVSSKLYYTYLRANSSFPELASYYSTVANQHSSDTAFYKHTRNLMIGSHVKMPLYQQAIDEYQNIINNSQNQNEIYYATLEKLRTIELMLDSLLNPGGYNSEYNNYPTHELSNLVKNFLLNNYSAINQNDRNRSENNKSENSREIRKDNNVKTSNNDVKKENIKRKEENKKQVAISNIKSDSKINKQNYINNLKKSISIDNLNLSKLKNSELLSLLDKIITIKLIEKSLLNFTPENRPLYRMKSNKNKGIHKNEGLNNLPKEFKLYQNYPNPFNPVTKINYDLPKDGKVKLVIYDILGREIKILVNNEFKQAGQYLIEFNGNFLASGIYFYRIQIEGGKGFTDVKKMVLIK